MTVDATDDLAPESGFDVQSTRLDKPSALTGHVADFARI
jgi:hypothetical protein